MIDLSLRHKIDPICTINMSWYCLHVNILLSYLRWKCARYKYQWSDWVKRFLILFLTCRQSICTDDAILSLSGLSTMELWYFSYYKKTNWYEPINKCFQHHSDILVFFGFHSNHCRVDTPHIFHRISTTTLRKLLATVRFILNTHIKENT